MTLDLRGFFRHTAVYMVGNLLYRGGAFVLLPLYTRVLTTADYGTLELLAVTATLFQTLLSSGIAHATLRFYFEYPEQRDRNAVVSTALILSFLVMSAGALVLCGIAPWISSIVFGGTQYTLALRVVFIMMVLETSREINLAFVRAQERSTLFVAMSILQLVVQVGANVVTVWYLHMGIVGVLVGNGIATTTIWLFLSHSTLKACGWRVEKDKIGAIARYGAPLMASNVFDSTVRSLDRYMLNAYTSLSVVGLAGLAMKIANIPTILIITPFSNSYGPYRFAIMKHPDAPAIYARVFNYYVFVASFVVLGLSILSRELLIVIAGPDYRAAYQLVPLFVVAAAAGGVVYCFQTGVYIMKRTGHMFYTVVLSDLIYLALIRLLVPSMGAQGLALANLAPVAFNAAYFYFASQRLFRVDYHFGQTLRTVIPAVVLGFGVMALPVNSLLLMVPLKLAVLAAYPFVVWLAGGIPASELDSLRTAWRDISGRIRNHAAA
jgi:O-antigen/teichoic acid export membrane protein